MKKKSISAFSIIELSIVLLIIGILIVGITESSRLVRSSKISTARSLTEGSPVTLIKNLTFWVDSLTEGSLKDENDSTEVDDESSIKSWIDINKASYNKITLSQTDSNSQPSYEMNGINDMPSVSFDGTSFLSSTEVPITAGDDSYTLVSVFNYTLNGSGQYKNFVSQGPTTMSNYRMGSMQLDNVDRLTFNGHFEDVKGPTINRNKSYIAIMVVSPSSTNNVKIFLNSNTAQQDQDTSNSLNIMSQSFNVGSNSAGLARFVGLISEVMIFDRNLNDREIADINSYLSQKYNIEVN